MKHLILLLTLSPFALFAQQLQPVTSVQADCGKFSTPIRLAGTVVTATVDNRTAACDGWVVTYSSNSFATVSILLQSANLTTGGAAGAFASFAGTITAGFSNPATATSCTTGTSCEIRATGYFPYVNVQITTTGTGYLQVEFHGFKSNPNSGSAGGSGCPGTVGTPCVVVGPTPSGSPPTSAPVLVAGWDFTNLQILTTDPNGALVPGNVFFGPSDGRSNNIHTPSGFGAITSNALTYMIYPYSFNGSTWDRQFSCTNRANITLTTSGLTRIIIGTAAAKIRLCSISIAFASPVDVQVVEGTQVATACDTGATNMTGLFRQLVTFDPNLSNTNALTEGTAADDVCISMSANVNGGGVATYAVF